MKKKFLLVAMMMMDAVLAFSQSSYYYYRGNKVTIQEDFGKVCVVAPKGNFSRPMQISPLNARRTATLNDERYDIAVYQTNSFRLTPTFRSAMKSTFSSTTIVLPCYKNSTGDELTLTNYLNIKLKNAGDYSKLQTIASKYRLDNIKQNAFMPLWYSMTITPQSQGTTLEIANAIFETGMFASSFASFSFDALECSYDPDFSKQWSLYNSDYPDIDISICSAWNYATGRGIKIAIVDTGIDMVHPDLAANIYGMSYDTETGKSPAKIYRNHATHCAGIAAAVRNNGIGISGVAPDSKLMSVSNRLSGGTESERKLADGINWSWKNGADIISCSWRSSENDLIADAIDSAIERGREGKGAIFVKSAGNQSGGPITWPGYYRPEVLTVGSVNSDGTRSGFASIGDAMDVVAPGAGIWSTFPNNTTGYDSGTSMAAPHASGLAALILERNPALTGQQVRNLIEQNTKKIGTVSYTTRKTNGTWDREYGYGLINAYETVKNTPRK